MRTPQQLHDLATDVTFWADRQEKIIDEQMIADLCLHKERRYPYEVYAALACPPALYKAVTTEILRRFRYRDWDVIPVTSTIWDTKELKFVDNGFVTAWQLTPAQPQPSASA